MDSQRIDQSVATYRRAQQLADAHKVVAREALYTALYDTQDLDAAEVALLLQMPPSKVTDHRVTRKFWPSSFSPESVRAPLTRIPPEIYLEAHNSAYANQPWELYANAPYTWPHNADGSLVVTHLHMQIEPDSEGRRVFGPTMPKLPITDETDHADE